MGRQHTRIFGSRPDTELVAIIGRGSEYHTESNGYDRSNSSNEDLAVS
jgi:hypothetical protein